MTVNPQTVAHDFYAAIEKAWNAADGPGFGDAFGAETNFVDIRGVRHEGGPQEIGASHQGIFDTIYKASVIRYDVETARALCDDVVVANARATLTAPAGPMAGTNEAISTVVLVAEGGSWRAVAFHNTLVATDERR
jgi:uncharacterized protein (TIGR02246 family)